ncbi:hypothetical protein RCS94_02960 [Orbaceae bacterium ac157xtp]
MLIAPSSYGALSATSANTIQGSRPGFAGHSGAKKLGFKIGNTTYSESEGNLSPSSSGVINYFNAGLTLNDFNVTSLTASDFSPANDYADADGDVAHPTTPFSMSPRTFEWRDSAGALIPTADYNKTLGCGSNLNLPLKLKITLPDVKVKSRYGNPSESIPTPLVQEYKIGTATGICFAKPNQMIVDPSHTWFDVRSLSWNSGNPTPDTTVGGGYSSDFDPVNGFKASLTTKFPTTGFPKASFTLIMVGNASNYTFSVLKPDGSLLTDGSVTVDTTGKVTLNSKPSGAVTIQAIFKNDTSQVHSYTFNPTTVWVVPKLNPADYFRTYNYAEAITQCGVESKIPSRAELTNSPYKTGYEGVSIPTNAFTRAVGGGVFGEWGWTDSTTYPGSQWYSSINSPYWTREAYSSSYRFFVRTAGSVNYYNVDSGYVACLR